jgi:hypothetical protein
VVGGKLSYQVDIESLLLDRVKLGEDAEVEIGVGVSHWELEAMLEVSELLVVLNVLDKGCRFGAVWEGSGGVGCNGTRVSADGFEVREGMKKRLVGRLVVLLLVFVLVRVVVVLLLDTRRCCFGESGITTAEDDKPNLEKRGVTS